MAISDDCNRADGAIGANYTVPLGDVGIDTNECRPRAGTGYELAYRSAESFNAAHSATCEITGTDFGGPAVHCSGTNSGNANGLVAFSHGEIQECINGSFSFIASRGDPVTNDDATLETDGLGTVKFKINGVQSGGDVNGFAVSGGKPGVGFFYGPGTRIDNLVFTGEVVAASTVHRSLLLGVGL